ncbi:hypothetical protein MP228_010444 [Amoeboaphelidium protococcarum]|nr:hypothetical protein MP228_010444 [Amoeboaphelidium protococcarum]
MQVLEDFKIKGGCKNAVLQWSPSSDMFFVYDCIEDQRPVRIYRINGDQVVEHQFESTPLWFTYNGRFMLDGSCNKVLHTENLLPQKQQQQLSSGNQHSIVYDSSQLLQGKTMQQGLSNGDDKQNTVYQCVHLTLHGDDEEDDHKEQNSEDQFITSSEYSVWDEFKYSVSLNLPLSVQFNQQFKKLTISVLGLVQVCTVDISHQVQSCYEAQLSQDGSILDVVIQKSDNTMGVLSFSMPQFSNRVWVLLKDLAIGMLDLTNQYQTAIQQINSIQEGCQKIQVQIKDQMKRFDMICINQQVEPFNLLYQVIESTRLDYGELVITFIKGSGGLKQMISQLTQFKQLQSDLIKQLEQDSLQRYADIYDSILRKALYLAFRSDTKDQDYAHQSVLEEMKTRRLYGYQLHEFSTKVLSGIQSIVVGYEVFVKFITSCLILMEDSERCQLLTDEEFNSIVEQVGGPEFDVEQLLRFMSSYDMVNYKQCKMLNVDSTKMVVDRVIDQKMFYLLCQKIDGCMGILTKYLQMSFYSSQLGELQTSFGFQEKSDILCSIRSKVDNDLVVVSVQNNKFILFHLQQAQEYEIPSDVTIRSAQILNQDLVILLITSQTDDCDYITALDIQELIETKKLSFKSRCKVKSNCRLAISRKRNLAAVYNDKRIQIIDLAELTDKAEQDEDDDNQP